MNIWDILVYFLLGILGMALIFIAMAVLSFVGQMDEEYWANLEAADKEVREQYDSMAVDPKILKKEATAT